MARYINLQDKTVPCAPLKDFDIKIYREKLNDKYGKSPLANQSTSGIMLSQKKNSKPLQTFKKQPRINPTFDLLQNKLKDFSSKKSASPLKQKTEQTTSPTRIGGMHQSISKISTLNFQLPSKQMRVGSMYNNVSQFNGSISEDRQLPTRFETEIPERPSDKQKNMTNLIPLHEIMNMRNKLENAQININQISSTYTNEMVKLASVINSQLKKQQK